MRAVLLRKILLSLTVSVSLISLALIIDIAISGSLYHPLTYFYRALSWVSCTRSQSPSCRQIEPQSSVIPSGKNGVVVTAQHEASKVGLQILKKGGNAIDAAVAVGYALAVTEPCCGNIGGGGFALIHLANGSNVFVNFREKAPLAANPQMYLDSQGEIVPQLSTKGYLAVAVPGTVMGLESMREKYGTMTREQVIAPAIKLAQQGFMLHEGDVELLKAGKKKLSEPNIATIFLKEGEVPEKSDRLIQKDLAQTLQLIATQGRNAFYKGAIANSLVKASRDNGGILSLEDFASYAVAQQKPLTCSYRGYQIVSAPPPGGGLTLCQMLNILEGYKLRQLGLRTAASLHLMLSAKLYAYADRNTYLGDPDFVSVPVEKLLAKGYAAQIRRSIGIHAIPPKPLYADVLEEGTNTTHYSILDRYGNGVAVTYTINSYFGAGVIASNTGFFLNNEMDDFAVKPGTPNQFGLVQGKNNAIQPGKRPLSSMSPTIVLKDGNIVLVTGSPGGSTIPTTVLQVITNVIDYDMNVAEAVNSPRIHYQGLPNLVITEPHALNTQVVEDLLEKGYRIAPFINWGVAETIQVDLKTGIKYGVNDSRRPAGKAMAY